MSHKPEQGSDLCWLTYTIRNEPAAGWGNGLLRDPIVLGYTSRKVDLPERSSPTRLFERITTLDIPDAAPVNRLGGEERGEMESSAWLALDRDFNRLAQIVSHLEWRPPLHLGDLRRQESVQIDRLLLRDEEPPEWRKLRSDAKRGHALTSRRKSRMSVLRPAT